MTKETIRENGCVIAEKTWDISSQILYVNDTTVLMQGRRQSYVVRIHKGLYPYMHHCKEGDTGFIKLRSDGGWIVGFQKKKSRFIIKKIDEKYPEETWVDDDGYLDYCTYYSRYAELDERYADYEVG